MAVPMRLAAGFAAGFLAVLIFHQGMSGLLHVLNLPGLGGPAPYSLRPIPPLGVPAVIDAAFWGGVYGVLYAAVRPRLAIPGWMAGLLLGLLAVVVLVLVVAPIKHFHPLTTWNARSWVRVLLIHLTWGLGVALLFALFSGSRRRRIF